MASYYIPSNKLKGEGKILYIFTGKSLIATAIGALIGLIFYFLFSAFNLKIVGIIIMLLFAVIGYVIVTVKIPANGNTRIEKNVGGETLYEIFLEYMNFKRNRKIYSYSVKRVEPDYIDNDISTRLIDAVSNKTGEVLKTKEDKK